MVGSIHESLSCPFVGELINTPTAEAVKKHLLECWHHLIQTVELLPPGEVSAVFYDAILAIMKREEFEAHRLLPGTNAQPACSESHVALAYSYRKLLFATLRVVTRALTELVQAEASVAALKRSMPSLCAARGPPDTFPERAPSPTMPQARDQVIAAALAAEQAAKEPAEPHATAQQTQTVTLPTLPPPPLQLPASSATHASCPTTPPPHMVVSRLVAESVHVVLSPPPPFPSEMAEVLPAYMRPRGTDSTLKNEDTAGDSTANPTTPAPVYSETPTTSTPAPQPLPPPAGLPVATPPPFLALPPLKQGFASAHVAMFCSKCLPLLFFRIPGIQKSIVASLPSPPESTPPLRSTARNEFPTLFHWPAFHTALQRFNKDKEDEQLSVTPKEWLLLFANKGDLFLLFLREWFRYIRSVIGEKTFDWELLPGHAAFVQAYLDVYREPPHMHSHNLVADLEGLVLVTRHPFVINTLMRIGFARTNVYEFSAVLDVLKSVEFWFGELKKQKLMLSPSFEAEHFCVALDTIIAVDHHILTVKVLRILYNFSEILSNPVRVRIFWQLLFKKYFFTLFLHWEDTVRNAFYQLLAFKVVHARRVQLVVQRSSSGVSLCSEQQAENISTDKMLCSKMDAYLSMVRDQDVNPTAQHFAPALNVYTKRSLSQYQFHMKRYYEWESRRTQEKPGMVEVV
eukprot:TRINITY_DN9169_c0_g1_i1.p1 TRINITY_DN9169_c0_g1~~TRINITY_DN9169_c0_g1_i1.p1  ORF type:complete len:784 (-),score=180.59 TRINITY_DN9169_c0_g1_i1:706-2763(-)